MVDLSNWIVWVSDKTVVDLIYDEYGRMMLISPSHHLSTVANCSLILKYTPIEEQYQKFKEDLLYEEAKEDW